MGLTVETRLVVRAAHEHWDWRSTLAGQDVLSALDAFLSASTEARPIPCLDSCHPWQAFPPAPTRGGGGADDCIPEMAVPAGSTKAREAEGEEAGSSDTVAGAAKDGAHTMARRYLEACRADYSAAAVKHAVSLGSELLKLAGSVEKAARALNQERVVLLGNHLAFTEEGHVLGVSDLHRALGSCVAG